MVGQRYWQQAPGCPQVRSFVQAEALLLLPVPLSRQVSSPRDLFKGAPNLLSQSASCLCSPLSPFLELGPGPEHPGMQRGWQENIANFLFLVSSWRDWKIQHSHALDLLLQGWAWYGRSNWQTSLLPSSALHTILTLPPLLLLPHPPLHLLSALTFLILSIIKKPKVLWDSLVTFAILYWENWYNERLSDIMRTYLMWNCYHRHFTDLENWGPERLRSLPKITHLVESRIGIWTREAWL